MKLKSFSLLLLLALALSACLPAQNVTVLQGDERDQVLAYSEDMADNLLAAMNNGDYTSFSRDLDAAMLKAMNEAEFDKMLDSVIPKIGEYQSREVSGVEKTGDYIRVVYRARFEKENDVIVRLVFTGGDNPMITGLWFDSPTLRKK